MVRSTSDLGLMGPTESQPSYHFRRVFHQETGTSMAAFGLTPPGTNANFLNHEPEAVSGREEENLLDEPFDISFAAPSMETTSDLTQDHALRAALLDIYTGTNDFDSLIVRTQKLEGLPEKHELSGNINATYKMNRRTKLGWRTSGFVVPSSNNEIHWKIDDFYLDLLICRGRDVGIAAILPNVAVNHTIEFKMELKWIPRTFSAKFAHLGFDPEGAMQYIGRTHRGEDAWIGWIPNEYQGHDLDDTDPITPGTCSGDTKMSKIHFNGSIMYFLGELAEMGYKDVAIYEPYPNLNDDEEVERATTLW